MKHGMIGALLVASVAGGSFYAWTRLTSEFAPGKATEVGQVEPSHRASALMIAAGDRASGTSAPAFEAMASDDTTYRSSAIYKDGPSVLIFVKEGCPCSLEADPFFQRVHSAAGGWVSFYGVIDGDVATARKWVEKTNTVFPILADPEAKIIHAFGAENSAYVAFVAPGGRIEKLWAGYSATMLKELADRMAPWVKSGIEPFDVSDAPGDLYAGCPY